ncbi:MAG: glycerophosphodiester phosphodiesterase [Anaerolineae bacterium]|nr:glycerophosphodiester phosphodiesterase [Anaerolineae bacterium]
MNAQSCPNASWQSKRWLRRGGCLSLLLLIPVLYYGLYLARRGPLPVRPQLIAHRGGSDLAPENTLAAFRQAIDLGVDWLEMDVQMTRDEALVVIHDETVDRTTNGTGRVADLTLAELRLLDAGNGEQVPTFEEVLVAAQDAGVGILPEIKSPHLYPGIETKVVQAVVEANYGEQTIIQSFDHASLETVHSLNPDIQLCALYGQGQLRIGGPQPGQASRICPMAEMVVLNSWLIRQAHAGGRQVFVWFGIIEHPLVMRFLLALGADGLIVDDPLALANILDR